MAAEQRRMARAETRALKLDEDKAMLEAQAQHYARPSDPVEAYAAGRTEPTANWVRAHREWVIDPQKSQKLTAAHHDAVAEGHEPDSDGYFSHVERFWTICASLIFREDPRRWH
jgi:hypothetical protein